MGIVRLRILGESLVEVGDGVITPESPQLFALALYFGCSEGRAIHKSELLELLFPDVSDRARASRNLRQLLYRFRRAGAPIIADGDRVSLLADCIKSSVDEFSLLLRDERIRHRALQLTVLPAYEPRVSRQFIDWAESLKSKEQGRVRSVLHNDLLALEQACEWERVAAVGRTLQELHVATEDLVSSVAKALLMSGRRTEALTTIDAFLDECDGPSVAALNNLRARILRAQRSPVALECTFHGRRDVMQDLVLQWRHTCETVPQLAVVTGPAGIGKSRLAQEFSSYVQVHGGQHLQYQCDRSDAARPYALFRSLLAQLRKMRGSLGASPELRAHLDLLTSEASNGGTLDATDSAATRAQIQLALIDLLEAVAVERPLLLVVDDAHLQDSASRSVSKALISASCRARVMILWCNRAVGRDDVDQRYGFRGQVHRLMPLSEDESASVLFELLSSRNADRETLRIWARRAGGNPYYLHAMAYEHLSGDQNAASSVFDVRRFAASTYFGLSLEARTLYETCVLLGPLASLERVQRIAAVDGAHLISALRDLETSGMICTDRGKLRCAHALLEEASSGLIPVSVTAALHHRIATELERESAAQTFPAALTWAAAEHWIAIGEVATAAHLLQRCASQAAALGEPSAAAQALLQIPLDSLGLGDRGSILSQLIEYAEAASDFGHVSTALRALRDTRLAMGYPRAVIRDIEFRIIEADMRHGDDPKLVTASLVTLAADRGTSAETRLRAAGALLIAADMDLDEDLANSTYEAIKPELDHCTPDNDAWQRVELIYHTVFGDRARAVAVVETALDLCRSDERSSAVTPRNVAHALMRLGLFDRAKAVLLTDFDVLARTHLKNEALYRMSLLGEICLCEGDLEEARWWIDETGRIAGQDSSCSKHITAGYFSAAAELALRTHQLDEAKGLAERARATYPAIGTARYAAIDLSLRLRITGARDGHSDVALVSQLASLYKKGASLGGQDTVVEALWLAEAAAGRHDAATKLLREYLLIHRREGAAVQWLLRSTTSHDPTWSTDAVSRLCEV